MTNLCHMWCILVEEKIDLAYSKISVMLASFLLGHLEREIIIHMVIVDRAEEFLHRTTPNEIIIEYYSRY